MLLVSLEMDDNAKCVTPLIFFLKKEMAMASLAVLIGDECE